MIPKINFFEKCQNFQTFPHYLEKLETKRTKNDKRNKKFLNTTFKTFFSNRRSQKIVCDNSFKGFLLNFLLN